MTEERPRSRTGRVGSAGGRWVPRSRLAAASVETLSQGCEELARGTSTQTGSSRAEAVDGVTPARSRAARSLWLKRAGPGRLWKDLGFASGGKVAGLCAPRCKVCRP